MIGLKGIRTYCLICSGLVLLVHELEAGLISGLVGLDTYEVLLLEGIRVDLIGDELKVDIVAVGLWVSAGEEGNDEDKDSDEEVERTNEHDLVGVSTIWVLKVSFDVDHEHPHHHDGDEELDHNGEPELEDEHPLGAGAVFVGEGGDRHGELVDSAEEDLVVP